MRRFTLFPALAFATFALATSPALAIVTPSHLGGHEHLEALDGSKLRLARTLQHFRIPRGKRAGFEALSLDLGGNASSSWDPTTKIPVRVWGRGVAVPAAAHAKHARALLDRHIGLLAPGASPGDFVLVSDDVSSGIHTIAFEQRASGLRVLGGQISFRFVAGHLVMVASEASPHARARVGSIVDAASARAEAEAALADVANVAVAGDVEGPFVLPLVGSSVRHATVLRVRVDSKPIGRWNVYVDAASGEPVAREQTLLFSTGSIALEVPERYPAAGRLSYPAQRANVVVDGLGAVSTPAGTIDWTSNLPASVELSLVGPWAIVQNDIGVEATQSFTLDPAGTFTWDAEQQPFVDAQLSAFVHLQRAKEYVLGIEPSFTYPFMQTTATVNIDDACNAYADATHVFFFGASGGCENTARISDVVFHEYGHNVHANSLIFGAGVFDPSLSEGLADYLSATITGDSGMARGFFYSSEPLREIDPGGFEYAWPDDVSWDPHGTGQIISGALWDLRKALVAKLGPAAGVAQADHLYFEGPRRSVDIPTMYHEVLVADDDDGDLSNGTPNVCEIDTAFAAHGLKALDATVTQLATASVSEEGYVVTASVAGIYAQCPGQDALQPMLSWHPRGKPSSGGTIPMSEMVPGSWQGTIPKQPEGTLVEYQVTLDLGPAGEYVFPHNWADPWYQLWVGEVVPLYCTDFEASPNENGWTHGYDYADPEESDPDDWSWGFPNPKAGSGDPTEAYSGTRVFGNDLGNAGKDACYPANTKNWADTPVVDTQGYEGVRLQYRRWLEIEGGDSDRARIKVGEVSVWTNHDDLDHRDGEWRFHDVDLSPWVKNDQVSVRFELTADSYTQFGGWTLDDLCIVGYVPPIPPVGVCGNGGVEPPEECDKGPDNSDTEPDSCRKDCTFARCGDGVIDSDEACDDGNDADGDGCSATCTEEPPPITPETGCGCSAPGSASGPGLAIAAPLLVLLRRRRRRA